MQFILWLKGQADKKSYIISMLITLAILLTGIFGAILLYQDDFSFLRIQISELAYPSVNPIGFYVFNTGMILAGILVIPHVPRLYRMLQPDMKILNIISAFFFGITGIGLIMIGLFPASGNYDIHIVGAFGSIGGIAVSCLFSMPSIIKKLIRKAAWPKWWHVLVTYGEMLIISTVSILLVAIPIIIELQAGTFDPAYPPAIWPLCEWLILMSSILWVCGIIFVSPKTIGEYNE
jgi:hypothetical membrane protein